MPSIDTLITSGGVLGLLALGIHFARLLLEWTRDRRQRSGSPSRVIGDAATANAVLVRTVETLQTENTRLVNRVQHLEDEDERKDRKITELERRLAEIADELSALRSDR